MCEKSHKLPLLSSIINHEIEFQNDIAIIQVNTDFEFNYRVNKVQLWLSHFAVNSSHFEYYTLLRASGETYRVTARFFVCFRYPGLYLGARLVDFLSAWTLYFVGEVIADIISIIS